MYRLMYFLPLTTLFILARFVFIAIGLITIPIATLLKRYSIKESPIYKGKYIYLFDDKMMFPWNNYEDGIVAGLEYVNKPIWFRIIYWSAIRNPANNLRYVKGYNTTVKPQNIKFVLKVSSLPKITEKNSDSHSLLLMAEEGRIKQSFYYLCWQGLYSNFRIELKLFKNYYRFWIGHKLYPSDKFGIKETDYRLKGVGIATQFKRLKK